jgi:hypothetical protein
MPIAGTLPYQCRDDSPPPDTPAADGKYTETSRAFTRKKFTMLPAGLTRGTAYRDSLEKQPEPPKDRSIAEIATMAEEYKLTSTGDSASPNAL